MKVGESEILQFMFKDVNKMIALSLADNSMNKLSINQLWQIGNLPEEVNLIKVRL